MPPKELQTPPANGAGADVGEGCIERLRRPVYPHVFVEEEVGEEVLGEVFSHERHYGDASLLALAQDVSHFGVVDGVVGNYGYYSFGCFAVFVYPYCAQRAFETGFAESFVDFVGGVFAVV